MGHGQQASKGPQAKHAHYAETPLRQLRLRRRARGSSPSPGPGRGRAGKAECLLRQCDDNIISATTALGRVVPILRRCQSPIWIWRGCLRNSHDFSEGGSGRRSLVGPTAERAAQIMHVRHELSQQQGRRCHAEISPSWPQVGTP